MPDAKNVKTEKTPSRRKIGKACRIKLTAKPFFHGDPEVGQKMQLPYAGKKITATVVDGIGGWYKSDCSAFDALCRTNAGQYFLAREVSKDRVECSYHARRTIPVVEGKHWLRVKRLSLRGAMIYATRGCGGELRADVLVAMSGKEAA